MKSPAHPQWTGQALARQFRSQNSFFVSNQKLYLLHKDLRCYIPLKKPEIISSILDAVPPEERDSVSNSSLEDAAKRLYRDSSNQRSKEKLLKESQFLLNLHNGVYCLETGKLFTGEDAERLIKQYCFTYMLNFSYMEGAKLNDAPTFLNFLITSLDQEEAPDKTTLLLEIMGICLSSVRIARKFYFLVGMTKSGKSVIADLLNSIIVPETGVTAFGLNQLSGRFNVQHLEYSRLNICRELTAGKVTGTDTLKMLVSEEPLFVEGKGKDGYVTHIHTKLLTCANQMPDFGEMDSAGNKSITDRMVVLKFNHTISEKDMDRHLTDKLLKERNVIFSLAVDTLKALHDRDYLFTVPQDTMQMMESYIQDSRSLEMFINERCQMNGKVHKSDFIAAYRNYCTENALSAYNDKEISAYIANCLPSVRKEKFRLNGKYLWGWSGISVRQEQFDDFLKEDNTNE